jgi:signal transduction histidine kinase/ActR/RegA family two-component response regulator
VVDTTPADPLQGLLAGPRREFRAGPGGERGALLRETPGFDARERPWYRAAVARGGPVWSEVYPFFAEGTLAIAASEPVYGAGGEPVAVVGADLALGRIGEFLRGLRIGDHGRTFIVERRSIVEGGLGARPPRSGAGAGLLIATSSAAETPLAEAGAGGAGGRLRAADSAEPLVAATARFLADHAGAATAAGPRQLSYRLGGERQLVDAVPLTDPRGLDWLIVSAVPEADFMAEVEASTRTTLWLCLAALAAALGAAVLVARAVSRPVRRLTRASGAIAGGRLDRRVETAGVAELGELARSFNRMAARLGRSFEELEARVAARTAELSRAKEAADAANRAKGDFLATVSHELRQPLAAILGYAELLAEGGGPEAGAGLAGEEAARALATIRDNGEHLGRLVDDLLDLEAIEAGRLEIEPVECDLAELLTQLHDGAAPRARARGLALAVAAEGFLPRRFTAGALRLRQVLANLLTNAVKYTERGGVTLTVRCVDGAPGGGSGPQSVSTELPGIGGPDAGSAAAVPPTRAAAAGGRGAGGPATGSLRVSAGEAGGPERAILVFAVTDTGPGIPEQDHERLFRPFIRLGSGEGDGFGLGLAIARRLVERMGGAIGVASRLGAGSTFRVELPVTGASGWTAGAALWTPPAPPEAAPPPRRLAGRVLVADDSRDLRELFERVLGRWGLATESVGDGREAVERAGGGGFDALLVDWQMPGLDGLAAVAELRRRGVGIPVVALTAAAAAADRERSLAAGCAAHVAKPVDFRRLRAALAAALGGAADADGAAPAAGASSSAAAGSRGGAGATAGPAGAAAGPRAPAGGASGAARGAASGGAPGGGAAPGAAADLDVAPTGDTAAVELEVALLAGRYLHRLPDQVAGLRGALAAGDWPGLHAAAHRLAGTAGSFRLAEIAALAAALEDAGGRSDRAAAAPLLDRLAAAVEARLGPRPERSPGSHEGARA